MDTERQSMAKLAPIAWAIVVGLVLLPNAGKAAPDDVAALRAELEALKADYTSRVQALETRIKQLESAVATAQLAQPGAAPAPPAFPQPPPVAPPGKSSNATAFNPAISMILTGNYASLSQDPATYRVAGFIPPPSGEGPGDRSFNLDESELTVASNVDPYFFGNVTAAIQGGNSIDIEEAYFLELGAEAGSGRSFPGTQRNSNSLASDALFAHLGGDVGDSTSWRLGVSWLDARSTDRAYDDVDQLGTPVTNAFSGTSRTWLADGTLKWAPHGDPTYHQFKLQGEYLHRAESGQLAFDVTGRNLAGDYHSSQSAWYVQAVYEFMQRWRAGLRYDSMQSGTPSIGLVQLGLLPSGAFPSLASASPERTTIMVDWSLSEFSRLRAQYAWDEARATERDRQLLLQYIFAMGAHGAHKF